MTVETIVHTQPRGGGTPIETFPANIISYGYRLNRPGSIEFTLPLDHEKTTRNNVSEGMEAVVTRNGAVVWVGPVLTLDEDSLSGVLTVRGEGLMAWFRRAFLTATLTYASQEQTTAIAWGLLNQYLSTAGVNLNVTNGTVATGRLRDRTYEWWETVNVFDALVQLSEVIDGFDFDFRPADRTFVTYYPSRGTVRDDIVFDERNIRNFRRTRDATNQASQAIGIGAGEGSTMLYHTAQSSTATAAYGLTQAVGVWKDVSVAETLVDHTGSLLNQRANPPNMIAITVGTVDPPLFSYADGDVCRVRWPSPYDPVDEMQRLIGRDVIWTSGEEQAVLYLEPI